MPTAVKPEPGPDLTLAFLFLSAEQREALSAVYAFCRAARESGAEAIPVLRGELEAVYVGRPANDLGRRLRPAVERFQLSREPFENIVSGAAMDLEIRRYRTFEGLETYLYRAGSSLGVLAIEIFGCRSASAKEYARWLGYGFRLTEILRDVGADLDRGRGYLPAADLERFGYSEADLRNRVHNAAFRAALDYQVRRARACFEKARAALDPADRAAVLPAEVMAAVSERLLENIQNSGYRVFEGRVALSAPEKLLAAAGAWWRLGRGRS